MVVNHAIRDFADRFRQAPVPLRRWTRPLDRRRRMLYLSSPIGLGHARPDLAVADELRKLHSDLQVDWLGHHPVTELLTADYNLEMIEQIGRFPRLRDRAVFVGNSGDVVPDSFAAGLPPIRVWVEQHYQFSATFPVYDPAEVADRAAIRAKLGYRPGEKGCLVTVGGSGVGADLRRVVAAYPAAKKLVPG